MEKKYQATLSRADIETLTTALETLEKQCKHEIEYYNVIGILDGGLERYLTNDILQTDKLYKLLWDLVDNEESDIN